MREGAGPGSAESPPAKAVVERSSGSSWLYSTLMVYSEPSGRLRRQMPPTASPVVRRRASVSVSGGREGAQAIDHRGLFETCP
jgi:hypothetical protein